MIVPSYFSFIALLFLPLEVVRSRFREESLDCDDCLVGW